MAYVRIERSTSAVRTARIMHDVPIAAPLVRLLRTLYPFGGRPKRRANPHAPRGTHRAAWLVGCLVELFRTVLTLRSPSPRARTRNVSLGEAGGLSDLMPTLKFVRFLGTESVVCWWG